MVNQISTDGMGIRSFEEQLDRLGDAVGKRTTRLEAEDWTNDVLIWEDARRAACTCVAAVSAALDGQKKENLSPALLSHLEEMGATIIIADIHRVIGAFDIALMRIHERLGSRTESHAAGFYTRKGSSTGLGAHHDRDQHLFMWQLEGRRTVSTWSLSVADVHRGRFLTTTADHTFELSPGDLLYLAPWTPHAVVTPGESLSVTFGLRGDRR